MSMMQADSATRVLRDLLDSGLDVDVSLRTRVLQNRLELFEPIRRLASTSARWTPRGFDPAQLASIHALHLLPDVAPSALVAGDILFDVLGQGPATTYVETICAELIGALGAEVLPRVSTWLVNPRIDRQIRALRGPEMLFELARSQPQTWPTSRSILLNALGTVPPRRPDAFRTYLCRSLLEIDDPLVDAAVDSAVERGDVDASILPNSADRRLMKGDDPRQGPPVDPRDYFGPTGRQDLRRLIRESSQIDQHSSHRGGLPEIDADPHGPAPPEVQTALSPLTGWTPRVVGGSAERNARKADRRSKRGKRKRRR